MTSRCISVSIDDLLSGEKIISIAEKENKANMQNICDLLFGVVDFMRIMLMILPLYPMPVNDYVYSVNLFAYAESAPVNRIIYWAVFILLTLIGAIKVILN